MKIVRLAAANIKRLVAVEIRPDGAPVVVIRGKNGAGKTSVLDSIAMALGGKALQPPKPIRQGAERAEVTVDLGDVIVKRTWTADDISYLEVASKEGAVFKSPQALLDKLVGRISFDPLAFTRLEAAKQAETMRQLVGLDFSNLNTRRLDLYNERAGVNRELKVAEGRLAGTPDVEAPDELADVAALVAQHKALLQEIGRNEEQRRTLARMDQVLARAQGEIDKWEHKVAEAQAALRAAERALADAKALHAQEEAGVEAERQRVASLQDPDLDAVTRQLEQAEAVNTRVRQRRARAELLAAVETSRATARTFTDQIDALDQEKAKLLAGAAYPIPGLGFDEAGGLTFNGLPFEQASAAEQLRVSVGVGLAMNPRIRVLLIRDGSLLDEANLALLTELAAERDAQIWLEVIHGNAGILIEEGAIAAASGAAASA